MTKVYVVFHVRHLDEDREDLKVIGAYSSEEGAKAAIARVASQPGFRENPDGFDVSSYILDKDHWTEGFVTVPREP